jgi:hypothetical protein
MRRAINEGEERDAPFDGVMIDANTNDLDWCADPTDLERALARRLVEIEPSECVSTPMTRSLLGLGWRGNSSV